MESHESKLEDSFQTLVHQYSKTMNTLTQKWFEGHISDEEYQILGNEIFTKYEKMFKEYKNFFELLGMVREIRENVSEKHQEIVRIMWDM